jgi:hypothetical protein
MNRESTANSVRLTIAIRSGYRFTITELFDKLCQVYCDNCGKTAPYIDVFNLGRRCMGIGGRCTRRHFPYKKSNIMSIYELSEAQVEGLPYFFSLTDTNGHIPEHISPNRRKIYDGEAASMLLPKTTYVMMRGRCFSSHTITFADILRKHDMGTDAVFFCRYCKENALCPSWSPDPTLPDLQPPHDYLSTATLSTIESIRDHVLDVHCSATST